MPRTCEGPSLLKSKREIGGYIFKFSSRPGHLIKKKKENIFLHAEYCFLGIDAVNLRHCKMKSLML